MTTKLQVVRTRSGKSPPNETESRTAEGCQNPSGLLWHAVNTMTLLGDTVTCRGYMLVPLTREAEKILPVPLVYSRRQWR